MTDTRASTAAEAAPDRGVGFVSSASTRWAVTATGLVVGAALIVAARAVPEGRDWYVAALVLAAAPFATAGLVFSGNLSRTGPSAYRSFWRRWLAAALTAYVSGSVALTAVLTGSAALWGLAAVLLIAAVPLWCAASLQMLRTQAGRRTVSVDLLDAMTALVVLGAPAVLLFARPLAAADHPWFALPFVASVVLMPGGLYLGFLSLGRVPKGQRATQAISLVLGAAFALNAGVQIAQVLSDFTLPMVVVVGTQVLNMGLLMAVPLWAHREPVSVLDHLLPEEQVRGNDPLALISVVLLPALTVFAWVTRDARPWGVGFVVGVLLLVVVLGALRNRLLRRETVRLYGELADVADERRVLVHKLVRSLEDDRRRMAAELHVQAVESFSSLSALVQSAYVTLPPEAAQIVKHTIAHVQDDLHARAGALRHLTAALRPPSFELEPAGPARAAGRNADPRVHEGALATALRAVATGLVDERSSTQVDIRVDPELELDWSTTTVVYRVAQEALTNAARHGRASRITVEVLVRDDAATVRVADDGVGYDTRTTAEGDGIASMRLLTDLGGGRLEIESCPSRGTEVRVTLGRLGDVDPGAATASDGPDPGGARHRLLLVEGEAEDR